MATDPIRQYEERKKPRAAFALRPGFEVRVQTVVHEGEKERRQTFEGIVTAITGAGLGKTFTVRRVVGSIGVERIFPMFSPLVTDVEVLRATKVRRARLTYLSRAGAEKRHKADETLLREVERVRAARARAKEETERKAREERAAEHAAQQAATKEKVEETTPGKEPAAPEGGDTPTEQKKAAEKTGARGS